MTEDTRNVRGIKGRIAHKVRRLVGTDVLAANITETFHRDVAHVYGHLTQQAERVRQELSQHVNQLQRTTEEHLDQIQHAIAEFRQVMPDDAHRHAAHLDGRLDKVREQIRTSTVQVIFEHRVQQNRSFSRDNLPSGLAVKQYYLQLKAATRPLDFDEVGVSVFSQNNEDGILMYIFSLIGMRTRRCIEIGCDLSASTVGIPEGNTANLICNFGFDGLIIDIDESKTGAIRHFFSRALTTKHYHAPARDGRPAYYFSPMLVTREVTTENINSIFQTASFSGEIDLLSIDVDGADILLWKAVDTVTPRVVMIEINNRLPFDAVIYGRASASTMPIDTLEYQSSGGSSLGAACEVAREKGYVFVGMDVTLLNAFFVRQDAWCQSLPERQPTDYVFHRMNPLLQRGEGRDAMMGAPRQSLDATHPCDKPKTATSSDQGH